MKAEPGGREAADPATARALDWRRTASAAGAAAPPPAPLGCFRRKGDDPRAPLGGAPRAESEDALDDGEGSPPLRCACCGRAITRAAFRIEVDGSHVHDRTNPGGFAFRIGCFAVADCRAASTPTTEHTWFPGYAWEIVHCPACDIHLGWRFVGGDRAFHGLILDRLVEERGAGAAGT